MIPTLYKLEDDLFNIAESFCLENHLPIGTKVFVTADGSVFNTVKEALEANDTLKNKVKCETSPDELIEPIEYTHVQE